MSPFQQDRLSEAQPENTSQWLSHIFPRQSLALAAVSVFLLFARFC
jgi:hypothetical protein